MAALRDIGDVAYVRFASVYRSFRDVNELMAEAQEPGRGPRPPMKMRPDAEARRRLVKVMRPKAPRAQAGSRRPKRSAETREPVRRCPSDRRGVHAPRARLRRARAWLDAAEPHGGRRRRARRARRRRGVSTAAPGAPRAEVNALARLSAGAARGDAVREPRALLPHGAHGAVHGGDPRRGDRARRRRHARSEPARRRARRRALACAARACASTSGCLEAESHALSRAFRDLVARAAAARDVEGRGVARRLHRRRASAQAARARVDHGTRGATGRARALRAAHDAGSRGLGHRARG